MKRYLYCALLFIGLLAFGITAFADTPMLYDSIPQTSENVDFFGQANVLDSGNPNALLPNIGNDIHAMRLYFEFALFVFLPILIAVVVIVAAIRWFSDTFTTI